MAELTHVTVGTLAPERFQDVLEPVQWEGFAAAIERARSAFAGRVVWNINSTAKGGGVVEMLRPLLAYARGSGVDARWLVIPGNPDFFRVTKRIHNRLHGSEGDGGGLGEEERRIYEEALAGSIDELVELVRPEDLVIVHDPQPAPLIAPLKERVGASVIWRCHVGLDAPNDIAREAWRFLIPYVEPADAYVFSREQFGWEGLEQSKIEIIPPSIDAFSPKNQELDAEQTLAILGAAGIVSDAGEGVPRFLREDGSPGRVDRRADALEESPLSSEDRYVLQVSRWDRLKDPLGVIDGFAEHVAPHADAHLVYAGPSVEAVADDPEGAEVLEEARRRWHELGDAERARVHLLQLPMQDGEENAAIVNALQRRAAVVVQKSIAEGFGLTVAEAMWKARPVVATRIGGIQDQIEDGRSGRLIDDARDLAAYGAAVRELLDDPAEAERMGEDARRRVRDRFLGPRSLMQYLELFCRVTAA
jgi:trehalose synthase